MERTNSRRGDSDGGRPGDGEDADSATSVNYAGVAGLREFFGETTMHGVQYTFRGGLVLRLLWLLAVLGCVAGFLYFFITAIINYLDRPTNTKLDTVATARMPVPAITFCNTNTIQAASLNESEANLAFLCAAYRRTNTRSCPFTAARLKEVVSKETRRPKQIFRDIGQRKTSLILDPLVNFFFETEAITFINSSYLETSVNNGGICHTYRAQGTDAEFRRTGADAGKKFLLNIDQNQYSDFIVELSVGVEVYIHNTEEPIVRGRNAIFVGPGERANIALKPLHRTVLPSPYRTPTCTEGNINRNKSKPYSDSQCQLECQEYYVASTCGCLSFTVPPNVTLKFDSGQTVSVYCTANQFVDCTLPALVNYSLEATDPCKQYCLEPCSPPPDHFMYDFSLSADVFPSRIVADSIVDVLVNESLYDYTSPFTSSNLAYTRENFAQVTVFYNSLGYDSTVQQKAVTLDSLFGSVGGNLGLFIGASLLTLAEFAQYLTRFFLACFRQLREKRAGSADVSGGGNSEKDGDRTELSDPVA